MNRIKLDDFVLEKFDCSIREHMEIVKFFDLDEEIKKYIITTENSFSDIIDYYNLYNDNTIYNKLYLVIDDDDIIGSIELDGTIDDLYINYCILEKYRNMGYCTKLLREITKYLLKEVKTISLLIKDKNTKSKNLALKTGYKNIGYDGYGYSKYQIYS